MSIRKPIRFKATLLLILFTCNVVTGMGCHFGLCICNGGHCVENPLKNLQSTCSNSDSLEKAGKSKDCDDDDCCNDSLIKLSQVDKSCPQFFTIAGLNFFTAFISSFYSIDILHSLKGHANARYYVRNHHPPIPDIRLAIQSFQI